MFFIFIFPIDSKIEYDVRMEFILVVENDAEQDGWTNERCVGVNAGSN